MKLGRWRLTFFSSLFSGTCLSEKLSEFQRWDWVASGISLPSLKWGYEIEDIQTQLKQWKKEDLLDFGDLKTFIVQDSKIEAELKSQWMCFWEASDKLKTACLHFFIEQKSIVDVVSAMSTEINSKINDVNGDEGEALSLIASSFDVIKILRERVQQLMMTQASLIEVYKPLGKVHLNLVEYLNDLALHELPFP